MSRLIDADVMIEYLRKQLCDNCSEETKEKWCDICDYAYLIDEMKKVPTVDAVEIVRCKDCINFYDKDNEGWGRCREHDSYGKDGGLWHEESFCDWAEREDEVTECTTHT